MTNSITLTHPDVNSGTGVRIVGSRVNVSSKLNLNRTPNEGTLTQVPDVLAVSSEIPTYTIPFKIDTESSETNILTLDLLYDFIQANVSSSNQLILTVTYGDSDTSLKSYQKVSGNRVTNIPVIVDNWSFSLAQTSSDKANMVIGSIKFLESK